MAKWGLNFSGHDFDDYQEAAAKFAIYPKDVGLVYTALGLVGEAGEYAEKIKKHIRDGVLDDRLAAKELGDVLWYLANAAQELGYDLSEIAEMNLEKLDDRKSRNKIGGNGDTR